MTNRRTPDGLERQRDQGAPVSQRSPACLASRPGAVATEGSQKRGHGLSLGLRLDPQDLEHAKLGRSFDG